MKVALRKAAPPPSAGGRPTVWPYHTMNVNEMFFVPNKSLASVSSYAWARGRDLGRGFVTRTLWCKKNNDGGWDDAEEGTPGATKGVGVYRTS